MASGDAVVQILDVIGPATSFAPLGVRVGGATPAEHWRSWAFDADAVESVDFLCRLHRYGGLGLTFRIGWASATNQTTGNVKWNLAIRAVPDNSENIAATHTYDFNTVTLAAPSGTGQVRYGTITFTNGVDMDNWANNELAMVRMQRHANDAADTMTGDAQLLFLTGEET